VGEHFLGRIDDRARRMSTALGGGVGMTYRETCGALSGGVLLIGALYGRARASEDDSRCMRLAARYRERFAQEIGATRCDDVRRRPLSCHAVVEQAARILLEVLSGEE
jgi:C_GCAxxG_C_C family probable redox protein